CGCGKSRTELPTGSAWPPSREADDCRWRRVRLVCRLRFLSGCPYWVGTSIALVGRIEKRLVATGLVTTSCNNIAAGTAVTALVARCRRITDLVCVSEILVPHRCREAARTDRRLNAHRAQAGSTDLLLNPLGKLCPESKQRISGVLDVDQLADLVEREDAVRPVAPFAGSINDGSLDRLDACDPALDVKPVGGNQGGSHHAPAQKVKPALRVRGKRTLHVDEKGTMLLKVDDEKVGRVGRPVVNFRAQPDASQCIPVVAHQHLEGSGHDWEGRLGRHDAKRWMLGSKPGHSLLEQPALVVGDGPHQRVELSEGTEDRIGSITGRQDCGDGVLDQQVEVGIARIAEIIAASAIG